MSKKILISTIPAHDPTKPPGVLSILAGCCESINVEYALLDLNLYMYKTLDTDVTAQLVTDIALSEFRSAENLQYYHQVCQHFVEQIKVEKPTHVAISVFTMENILAADTLLKYIKNAELEVMPKIIIGGLGIGNSVTTITGNQSFGDYCINQHLADYCVYGEGELAFIALLQENFEYPGINRNNPVQIKDLDSLPIPSYKKLNPQEYFYADSPEVLVTGSRGCVRDCTFCNVSKYWNKYIYKSGQRLADELFDIWQTTQIQKFDFSDSLINGSIKVFREFNKALLKYRNEYPGFTPMYKGQFICRPEGQLKEQDYREMSAAGAQTLVVGIESFSEDIRNHMRKKFDNQSIDWHFEMCAKYGIQNVLLLLCGYVTETGKDHLCNLEYLKRYQKYALSRVIYAVNIAIQGLMILPDTPLSNMIDDLGIHYDVPDDKASWISMTNPGLTPKERLRRGVELVLTAYTLGFKVLHFNQKVDEAQRQFELIQQRPERKTYCLTQV